MELKLLENINIEMCPSEALAKEGWCGAKKPDGTPIKYKHCHGKNA